MKKSIKVLIIILMIALLLFLGLSWFLGSQVVLGSTQLVTCEETNQINVSFLQKCGIDYEEFCENYMIEQLEITSTFEGHTIPADYIYAPGMEGNKNNRTVILVHGLEGNRYTNYPLAELFLEKGYNVLTYDQRSSNENAAQYTAFGYFEKYDLTDCIDYVSEYAPEQTLGVWSTSFGGATAGLAMEQKETEAKIDFLILDCPVSSMKWMVEEEMRKMNIGLPVSYMTFCGNIMNKLELGFFYEDADVSEAMKNVEIPVLIINSKMDTITPQFMGQDIYDAIISDTNKMIWTVEDSEHTQMWLDYNREYREKVEELLD